MREECGLAERRLALLLATDARDDLGRDAREIAEQRFLSR